MLKRPHYVALGLLVLLVVVLLKLPSETAAKFKLAVGTLFVPLFGLAGTSQNLADKSANALLPKSELIKEADRLKRENDQLRVRLMQAEETFRENQRLREHVQWQKQLPWKPKLARVIARDPANWWRTLQVDLGSRDGVQTNLPVVTRDGLVGRVASVGYSRSQVVLLGDPNLRVGVFVQDKEMREAGVVVGTASPGINNQLVELSYLSRSSALKPGQAVVTSGDGGIFPKGIPVGQILDLRPIEFGMATEARVRLLVNFNTLEEVWVMFP